MCNLLRVQELLDEPIELPQFPGHAMNATRELFGADICFYSEIDVETLRASVVFDVPRVSMDRFVDAWAHHVVQEPLLSYWRWLEPGFVVRLSDFGTQARIRGLDIYESCLRPMGIEHHLLAPLVCTSNRILSIGYGRGGRDFSEDDRSALMILRRQLTSTRRDCQLHSIALAGEARVDGDLSITHVEMIVVGRDRRIRSTSDRAIELVRRHVGELPPYCSRLPHRLADRILDQPPIPCLRAPLQFGELQVYTRIRGDEISLYLRHRQALPLEELMVALDTTRRRAEVGRCLCQGQTAEDLADELKISVGTVRTHIEDLYADLDVSNRLQAVDEMRRRVTEHLRRRQIH